MLIRRQRMRAIWFSKNNERQNGTIVSRISRIRVGNRRMAVARFESSGDISVSPRRVASVNVACVIDDVCASIGV